MDLLIRKWRNAAKESLEYFRDLVGIVQVDPDVNVFRKLTLNEVSLNLKFDLSMLGIYDTENDEIKSI
jgi:hypothetical protein